MTAATYDVLVAGFFRRFQVTIRSSSESIAFSQAERRAIATRWDRAMRLARDRGVELFPGPLLGLRGHAELPGGGLELLLGPTDYREFVGTNVALDASGDIVPDLARLSNPLGVSAAVYSSDGMLIVGRRSLAVFERPGALDVFGGHVEPGTHPFDSICDEVHEELGVAHRDVGEPSALSLVRVRGSLKPELCFVVPLKITADRVEQAVQQARDGFETSEVLKLDAREAALRSWLQVNRDGLAPSGLATIEALINALAGGMRF